VAAPAPSNAPLSLAPPGGSPQPSRLASAPANIGASGGFTVQVSSQRSEAEAQTAFRGLQAKFPNELGGRQPIIRRADLGDKGTFYRAQVGPFATSEQASEFCGSLKAAGGQCVVQRN
jgi:cell division septation protein DedD